MKKYKTMRMETFSDGVMAIIITIMVLDIPMPQNLSISQILQLAYSILVFFVSFVIVGTQWYKHHHMLADVESVTNKVLGRNMLFLFFLSLIPPLTKWVFLYPQSVIPVIAYDVAFIITNICNQYLWNGIVSENEELKNHFIDVKMEEGSGWIRFVIMFICLGVIIGLSILYPLVSIVFFIAFPLVTSFINVFWGSRHDIIPHIK